MTAKPDDGIGKKDGNGGGTRASRWPPDKEQQPAAVVDQDYPLPTADEFLAKVNEVRETLQREEAGKVLEWLAAEGCFEGLSAEDMEAMKDSVANGKHRGEPGK